jgi:hypothetical protein
MSGILTGNWELETEKWFVVPNLFGGVAQSPIRLVPDKSGLQTAENWKPLTGNC